MKQENFVFIISSPSGAGKTSLAKEIVDNDPNFVNSVSCTTRDRRPLEVEGKDYHFISKAEFKQMNDNDEFLEYAEVFGNYYGSPKEYVKNKLSEGFDIMFDIDWQGAEIIKSKLKDLVVSLFILPPSMQELEKRLRSRGSNAEEDIAKRMENAPSEISKYHLYDYVIVNENFDITVKKISTIIEAERLKRCNFENFIKKLAIS